MLTKDQQAKIEASCAKHEDRLEANGWGITVSFGTIVPAGDTCSVCAIGAYALDHKIINDHRYLDTKLAAHFEISVPQLNAFTHGFDGHYLGSSATDYREFFDYGKQLRIKFL